MSSLQIINTHMGMFDYTVCCAIGDYEETVKFAQRRLDDNDTDFDASNKGYLPRGKTFHRPGYVPIIWIPSKPASPREHATLAHEAIHAVFCLLGWASVPIDKLNDEVIAHATGHIVNRILEKAK